MRNQATGISCTLRWDPTAYAVFIKESRMRCINATKLHRKSGVIRALPCSHSYTLATLESRLCKK